MIHADQTFRRPLHLHRASRLANPSFIAALLLACVHLPALAQWQPVTVVDQRGFAEPIPAVALAVPAGWSSQGGVDWHRDTPCSANQMRVRFRAVSPDNRQALELMHAFSWQVQGTQIQMNPCPVAPFASNQALLMGVMQQRRPGARALEYRNQPERAEAARAAAARNGQANPQVRTRHDAGQLFISWQADGQVFHEVLSSVSTFTQVGDNVMGGTGMVVAQRAPAGRLDPALGNEFTSSLKPNPVWLSMATQSATAAGQRFSDAQRRQIDTWHAAEMARINAKGAADRAAIRAETAREVGRINSQTWANTQTTNDNIHRRTLEGVGEYNTYRDSSGQPVRSSIHGGDRVLRLPDGTYTSTRDPYYRPPGSEELQRVR